MEVKISKNKGRFCLPYMVPEGSVGVECGIAEGVFAQKAIESGRFSHYFGIDAYNTFAVGGPSKHNTQEYKNTLKKLGIFGNFKLFRMPFDDALGLFPHESLDFVYIDGYAHTGENEGVTIASWYLKVKPGGLFAGDDYNKERWPLVVRYVDEFLEKAGYGYVNITNPDLVLDKPYCQSPSWFIQKKENP